MVTESFKGIVMTVTKASLGTEISAQLMAI